MKIIDFFKGLIYKMLKRDDIKTVVGQDIQLSVPMYEKISLWGRMFAGQPPWADENVHSMRIEQGICKELANIALNEMTATVTDEKLNEIFKQSVKDLNENVQKGLALGSFIIRPINLNKAEYLTPDRFVPIKFGDDGKLISVAFIDVKAVTKGSTTSYYRRFEFHELTANGLLIYNKAYFSTAENEIGRQIPLASVEAWAKLPEEPVLYPVDRADFGYYRNPIPNTIDGSPCGVSVFDCAIDLIRKSDVQNARIDWEFESGERAIHVDAAALRARTNADGTKSYSLPKLNKRLYRGVDIDGGTSGELFKEFSPEFRDSNLINGLNAYLRRIEFNCSLAYGDLSDVSDVAKTATEIKTAKQRKYNMVTAIQENLKECLEDFVFALAFYNSMATRKYEFICDFKDSILTDEAEERKQDMADVAAGVMNLWEYRMKWYSEDEATAKKMIPQQVSVIE